MLLKEVRVLTDLKVISESRETGVMCIRGTFQRAEEENHNRRIYPKAVLESCVKNLHEKLSGRELVGELDHPADGVVKLQNASHLITKLEWQGNDLIGEAEILPTPAGQIAKSLINAGVKIGISSRGMGTLSEASEGSKIVNDDYKMITFDLVADPSTKGAYPSLAESKQHALDFVENVIKPAISEKAFVARLKKALNESKGSDVDFNFDVLLEGEKRTNRQLASKNIPAAKRAKIAATRKAKEKFRFDDKPPATPKKSAKAKKHDDNIAAIHKKKRQLGDEWTRDGLDPQYESRREAARAKLEEMCGPKKHGKKKKVNENSYKPLTLTSLHEQQLINEAVPAILATLGRGAVGLAKGVGRGAVGLARAAGRALKTTGTKAVDNFAKGYKKSMISSRKKDRADREKNSERSPLNPRKYTKRLVHMGQDIGNNVLKGIKKPFVDAKRRGREMDRQNREFMANSTQRDSDQQRQTSLDAANNRFMTTLARDTMHDIHRRDARKAELASRKSNLRKRAAENARTNENVLPLTLDRLEEGLFRFGGKVLGHGLRTAGREKWVGRAGAGIGKAIGGTAGLAGYLGGKKLGAATTKMGAQAGKAVGATLGRLGDYTAKQMGRPDLTRKWGEKADQYVVNKAKQLRDKSKAGFNKLKARFQRQPPPLGGGGGNP